jgi:hypothetical protein
MNFLQLAITQQANPEGRLPGAFRIRAFNESGDAVIPTYNGPDTFVAWPEGLPFATYRVVAEYLDSAGTRFGNEFEAMVAYSAPGAPATLPVPAGAFIGPLV